MPVRGSHDPDVIAVQAGRPVRPHLLREKDAACGEHAFFPNLAQSAHLPRSRTPSKSHHRRLASTALNVGWACCAAG